MKWTCTVIFAIVCLLSLSFPAQGQSSKPRPNIVVILADDAGYSDLGCYGSEIRTPWRFG